MLHPHVKVGKSKVHKRGLFATRFIPKGTIVWRLGEDDKIYNMSELKNFSKRYRQILGKFGYVGDDGRLVYVAGDDKYQNHSCEPNTPSWEDLKGFPGSHFNIAIKDIFPGEEIMDDYGLLFRVGTIMKCNCGAKKCRKIIRRLSPKSPIYKRIEKSVHATQKLIKKVHQPLFSTPEIKLIK